MDAPAKLAAELKQRAAALGFDAVGITSAAPPPHAAWFQEWLARDWHGAMGYLARRAGDRLDPQRLLPGARSIVVAGMNYGATTSLAPTVEGTAREAARPPTASRGTIARYAQGSADYHDLMLARLEQLADHLRNRGQSGRGPVGPALRAGRNQPGANDRHLGRLGEPALPAHDIQTRCYVDTGPVLERDFAQRAGLGFIGKHTNLISRQFGNWLLLGEILTTLELPPDTPGRELCGTCTRCLAICPTQAIVAPYQLDARRCISYLTIELKGSIPVELRPLIGEHLFGCDDCLAVCPWNRFARASAEVAFAAQPVPPLVEMLGWTEAQFGDRFRGTPIARVKRRGWLRNICVVLGNQADPATLPALARAAQDSESLVREHAAWAVKQLQHRTSNTEHRTSK